MKAYTMVIRTDSPATGKTNREVIRHIPATELDARREAARTSAPRGTTRTVNVADEV